MLLGASDQYDEREVASFRAQGYWQDATLTDYLEAWATAAPQRVLATDGSTTLTYADARGSAYRLATALLGLGVRPGDRVAVQLPNWNEFVVAYLALARLGAILVPIMPIYRAHDVEFVLGDTAAVAAITCGEFRRFDHQAMFLQLRDTAASLRTVIVARTEPRAGALAFAALCAPADDDGLGTLPPGPAADDDHVIIYTSGTESRPKGCCHTFNTFGFTVRQAVASLGLGESDVTFVPSPVTHTTGLAMGVALPLVYGGSMHLLDVWEPATAVARMAEYGCTNTTTAATFLQMVLDVLGPHTGALPTMRIWLSGGAPVPPSLVEAVGATLPNCQVLTVYGRSETLTVTQCRPEDSVAVVLRSDGRPQDGVKISIRDDWGNPVPAGEEGEICYRGPGLMLGYWRRPDLTRAATTDDGWSRSGDLGRLDENGYLRVTGRIKDVIVRGGSNISAREVEEYLLGHPKVREVAVVGVPDPVLGERACAFVVPVTGTQPTLGDLVAYLRDDKKVTTYKLPERLELVDELPMTASGKVQKFVLRDRVVNAANAPSR